MIFPLKSTSFCTSTCDHCKVFPQIDAKICENSSKQVTFWYSRRTLLEINATKYSRIDQVKFVEGSL